MIGSPYNCVGGSFMLLLLPLLFCSRDAMLDDDCSPVSFCEKVPPYPPEGGDQRNECVVGSTSDARNLAEAVRCSGGVFEVEWKGSVIVHETISVVNGTVLKVVGSGPDAVIDGDGSTRIFTLDNASLDLSKVEVINGASANSGGAIAASSSNLAFRQTSFYGNNAIYGGALFLSKGSSATFDKTTRFQENTAGAGGGALYLSDGSTAVWIGETVFSKNSAGKNGGAIYNTLSGSNISWRGGTDFIGNTASLGVGIGGGGAIFVGEGAKVEWNGTMNFTSNFASWDGGAVAAESASGMTEPQSSLDSSVSRILVGGPTIFFNNTCGGNGGGMSLSATSSVYFDTSHVTFSNNSAALAGGAVFISDIIDGPMFLNVDFNGNSAQVGGGMYTTQWRSTVTMDGCSFVGNVASSSGGAMENVGHVECVNTSFVANSAAMGGALRLAGITSLHNCTFVENISEEGGGAAVSNIGYISAFKGTMFKDNLFNCETGSFFDFREATGGALLHGICNGCPSCDGCFFSGWSAAPTCTLLSEAGIYHASSPGGITTIEGLRIARGYWRATNTSTLIRECDNRQACKGGLTGSRYYCSKGYYGPLCGICTEGYRRQGQLNCSKCSSLAANLGVAAFLAAVCVALGVTLALYMVSGKIERSDQGVAHHMGRHVPFQSIRIIIVTWQILSQFTSSVRFTYTFIYQTFLDFVAVFNFDIGWAISLGCIFELDFDQRMFLTTLAPTVVLVMLAVTYIVAVARHRGSETALRNIRHKHLSMVLLVMFLVYASVSSVLLPMFGCDAMDDGNAYLWADYRVECHSLRHQAFRTYAVFMTLLYPVGIPAFYFWLLFRNGDMLANEARREDHAKIQPTSDLWKAYKPSRYYFEIIECIRRLAITFVVVLIYPGTAAQFSVAVMVTFGFGIMMEVLAPYKSPWDTWISRAGYVIDFSSMFYASQLKVDTMEEQGQSSEIFDAILVGANCCMVMAVVVQGVISLLSSRVYEHKDPVAAGLRHTGDRGEAKVV